MVAASALILSIKILKNENQPKFVWNDTIMPNITGFEKSDLINCSNKLMILYKNIAKSPMKAVVNKFKSYEI